MAQLIDLHQPRSGYKVGDVPAVGRGIEWVLTTLDDERPNRDALELAAPPNRNRLRVCMGDRRASLPACLIALRSRSAKSSASKARSLPLRARHTPTRRATSVSSVCPGVNMAAS